MEEILRSCIDCGAESCEKLDGKNPPFCLTTHMDGDLLRETMALYTEDLETFNLDYLNYTAQTAGTAQDRDLSADSMVIGTSAIVDTEIDGAVGMNSGIFNNPFMIWGRYRRKVFRYYLSVSFQFHHTQMDGAHAGRFLRNLQNEINRL